MVSTTIHLVATFVQILTVECSVGEAEDDGGVVDPRPVGETRRSSTPRKNPRMFGGAHQPR